MKRHCDYVKRAQINVLLSTVTEYGASLPFVNIFTVKQTLPFFKSVMFSLIIFLYFYNLALFLIALFLQLITFLFDLDGFNKLALFLIPGHVWILRTRPWSRLSKWTSSISVPWDLVRSTSTTPPIALPTRPMELETLGLQKASRRV